MTCYAAEGLIAAVADEEMPVVRIPDIVDGVDLAPYLSYWYDQNEQSSYSDAYSALRASRFSLLERASPNLGFRSGSHWFLFALRNESSSMKALLVDVAYPILDKVDFYCHIDQKQVSAVALGDHRPYKTRPILVHNFLVPLMVQANHNTRCLVRVNSHSNIMLPIKLYDKVSYVVHEQRLGRLQGILYGIVFALAFYSLMHFFQSKENLYISLLVQAMSCIFYMCIMDGTLASMPFGPWVQDSAFPVAIVMTCISMIYFAEGFLDLREGSPFWHKIGLAVVMLCIVFLLPGFFLHEPEMYQTMMALLVLACIYSVCAAMGRWLNGYRPALIYLIWFASVTLMVLWIFSAILVLNADLRWIIYGGHLAWICELIALALMVAIRERVLRGERLALQQRLRMFERDETTKSQLMSMLGHELRVPMNGIAGLLKLIRRSGLDDNQARYLKTIDAASDGLFSVVNDVLEITQLEAGKQSLVHREFDLSTSLFDACALFEFDLRQKSIRLRCSIGSGTPLRLLGDAGKVRQVLLNLLSNAVEFTESGAIEMEVHLTDQIHNDNLVLRFEVFDSGVGMSYTELENLFKSGSSVIQGGRIGLLISRHLIDAMGGSIGARSEQGRGTRVWVTLPFALPEEIEVAPKQIEFRIGEMTEGNSLSADKQRAKSDASVLVVEDNKVNQHVIDKFLERLGIRAEIVDTGAAAWEKIRYSKQHYDLILMDCETPIMNGFEAATRIIAWQTAQQLKPIPIVALSAHTLTEYRQKARDTGMADYIAKPVTLEKLKATLAKYLPGIKISSSTEEL